jgi:hypothetical protein
MRVLALMVDTACGTSDLQWWYSPAGRRTRLAAFRLALTGTRGGDRATWGIQRAGKVDPWGDSK